MGDDGKSVTDRILELLERGLFEDVGALRFAALFFGDDDAALLLLEDPFFA